MRLNVEGATIIRHADTDVDHSIVSEDLDWQCESDERGMGQENHYMATMLHPQLGSLSWSVYEYPIGVLNLYTKELGGHSLVQDFSVSLEHEEDEPWE
ncbi:hypothetical protein [Sphingomonas sp. PR090111-T3T-6A]|uniref:hypothetical protein n=1 Tax=Sphingomonas sp. PR090111-T3T-6A TaxID=685778 RepID=UPI00037053D5|nr:hypothetical protein [Sphingomonas sp. PR090111-T3T-6A]